MKKKPLKTRMEEHLSETEPLIRFVKDQMKAQPDLIKKIDEIHNWLDFLVNKITVNGDDGSKPVIGAENIFEAHHKNDKAQNRAIEELRILTQDLRVKKKFWESFRQFRESSGTLTFFLKPNKYKVGFGVILILLILELIGIHTFTQFLRPIVKMIFGVSF